VVLFIMLYRVVLSFQVSFPFKAKRQCLVSVLISCYVFSIFSKWTFGQISNSVLIESLRRYIDSLSTKNSFWFMVNEEFG